MSLGQSCRVVQLTRFSEFLKERLFGLSNPQGNHGESIKETHFHLDNTPTVSVLDSGYWTLLIDPFKALLHEVPLQVPSEKVSIRGHCGGECKAR